MKKKTSKKIEKKYHKVQHKCSVVIASIILNKAIILFDCILFVNINFLRCGELNYSFDNIQNKGTQRND